mgnify:CR=1 FL=1
MLGRVAERSSRVAPVEVVGELTAMDMRLANDYGEMVQLGLVEEVIQV